jgi:hypothetical protein
MARARARVTVSGVCAAASNSRFWGMQASLRIGFRPIPTVSGRFCGPPVSGADPNFRLFVRSARDHLLRLALRVFDHHVGKALRPDLFDERRQK